MQADSPDSLVEKISNHITCVKCDKEHLYTNMHAESMLLKQTIYRPQSSRVSEFSKVVFPVAVVAANWVHVICGSNELLFVPRCAVVVSPT